MVRERIGRRGKKKNENERKKRESFGLHGFFLDLFFRPIFYKNLTHEKERKKDGGKNKIKKE
jgi:hypothetical protein